MAFWYPYTDENTPYVNAAYEFPASFQGGSMAGRRRPTGVFPGPFRESLEYDVDRYNPFGVLDMRQPHNPQYSTDPVPYTLDNAGNIYDFELDEELQYWQRAPRMTPYQQIPSYEGGQYGAIYPWLRANYGGGPYHEQYPHCQYLDGDDFYTPDLRRTQDYEYARMPVDWTPLWDEEDDGYFY